MPKLHYDHKFNKALATWIVLFVAFILIGGWWAGILGSLGYWLGYNFNQIYEYMADV